MTARNQNTQRIDMVNSKRKKAKESMGEENTKKKTFGMAKKSVQISDSNSLSKSTKATRKVNKIKSKINQSLIDYNEKDSVKKTKDYQAETLGRTQSAFELVFLNLL